MGHHNETAALIKKKASGGGGVVNTFNPLDIGLYTLTPPSIDAVTLSEGNTRAVGVGSPVPGNWYRHVRSVLPITGNVYFEVGVIPVGGINANMVGLLDSATILDDHQYIHTTGEKGAVFYTFSGDVYIGGVSLGGIRAKLTNGLFIGMAVRVADKELYICDSTGWLNGADPVTRTNPFDISYFGSSDIHIYAGPQRANDGIDWNTSDKPIKFTLPTGYTRV